MKTKGQNALFRTDASSIIGGGHVMRCLTLADELRNRGWRCTFFSSSETVETIPALLSSGHDVKSLDEKIDHADVLIVDHYGLDRRYEEQCRAWVKRIVVIDDLADRPHDCDILMDQTFGRNADDYKTLVPAHCKILTGPDYALLRPQFAAARSAALSRRKKQAGKIENILIMMGASDPDNATALALSGVERVEKKLKIDIILGANAPHLQAIKNQAGESHHDVTPHAGVSDVAALMARADLCIGAGGTASWERCCMALPTLLVEIADNQKKIIRELENAGAGQFCGHVLTLQPDDVVNAINALLHMPDALVKMVQKSADICDGLGTQRLGEIIEHECAEMVA